MDCSASILNSKNQRLREWSAILAIFSSSASIIGCLLIIIIYIVWREFRTTARTILLFISIADLFTATGYVIGSAVYLHYKIYTIDLRMDGSMDRQPPRGYNTSCKSQSFVTTASSVASFFWTTVLAFYLYMTIVHKMYKFVRTLMPLIHVISWGVPLVLCSVALARDWLGPSLDDTSVSWCFVAHQKQGRVHREIQLLLGKGWEVVAYILVIIFYTLTKIFIEVEVSVIILHLHAHIILSSKMLLCVHQEITSYGFLSIHTSCYTSTVLFKSHKN